MCANIIGFRYTWVICLRDKYVNPIEKEMATHSSILAWKIPWTEQPGGLQSTKLQDTAKQLTLSDSCQSNDKLLN